MNSTGLLDEGGVEAIERLASEDGVGVARRLMLVCMMRDPAALSEVAAAAPDQFVEMREAVIAYRAHLDLLARLAEEADRRLGEAGQLCMPKH